MQIKEIDKIAFIYLLNGNILMTRSKGKTTYYIPGGKRESDETDEQTLQREIVEELSVVIIPSTIQYLDTFTAQADGKVAGVIVKMTCYKASFNGDLRANNEIAEIRWMNYSDIGLVSPVDKIIFNYLRDKGELD